METNTLESEIQLIAQKAKVAFFTLSLIDTATKNKALEAMASGILANKKAILEQNNIDTKQALELKLNSALIDRLTLNENRVEAIAQGLKEMAQLPDPVGEILREWSPSNGMNIKQTRVPLGVIGMIYESRPNVTAEAAGLCLKSGNAVILRGGREASHSNKILVDIISKALQSTGLPENAVQFLPPEKRESIRVLSRLNGLVDLIIARGSEKMILDISANATVPVLGHGKGVCHVYIDKEADMEKAINIAFNSKAQRPGVCNAMETLLVHEYMMMDILPKIAGAYIKAGIEMRGDDRVRGFISQAKEATDSDWGKEFHDKIVAIKIVDSLEEAIEHINKFGSRHTDSIVTEDKKAATFFQKAVDSSCVMHNTSTRLHDGSVFGFGSEIGISTQKLHARGTMGLRELTTTKYIVEGTGQIRE
ncbi:MAG: glutamate-5-semialdehyde dehydrogenase [Elusimicrobiota bacterium]